ncbi:MAG TPA: hypothetical protein VGL78_13240 [Solirubrobacteraceae bacterium]|jgi:hypothetical protein
MNDKESTQAEQSLEWLATDQRKLLTDLRAAAADVPRLASRVEGYADEHADAMSMGLRELTDRLFPVMSEGQPEHTQALGRLSLAMLHDDEAIAMFTRFGDGSSRVLVSSGLISMLHLLAELTSIWYHEVGGAGWRRAFKMIRAINRLEQDERLIPVLAVALRWNVIHRRVWGNSATLAFEPASEESVSFRDLSAQMALVFVLAHECAHGLLGHDANNAGDWDAELAADAMAFRATQRFIDVTEGNSPPLHALLAARLAFFTSDLIEHVLFVRPPVRHPSAHARWEALVDEVGDRTELAKAEVLTAGLDTAVGRASDLRFALPASWWATAYKDRRVHCDVHEPDYYEHFPFLDRMSFGDPDDPARMLNKWAGEHGLCALQAAFTTRDEGLEAGLRALGVDAHAAQAIASADAPLSTYTLTELVLGSPAISVLPTSTLRRLATVATVTLMSGVEQGIL